MFLNIEGNWRIEHEMECKEERKQKQFTWKGFQSKFTLESFLFRETGIQSSANSSLHQISSRTFGSIHIAFSC
jgi:hypothetical protein